MADISNKTLGILASIALIISVAGVFSVSDEFNPLSGFVTYITTGQVRINVTQLAAINITKRTIDFGNSTLESAAVNCTLNSEDFGTLANSDPRNCWVGNGAVSGGIAIVNVGNVIINVTVTATKNGSLTSGPRSFWGTKGGKYLYRCKGNGTTQISGYTPVANASRKCVTALSPLTGVDGFTLHVNITIPANATGLKNDTFTFLASRA